MRRELANELMDQPMPNTAELSEALGDLTWYNRHLGGTATIIHQVERLLAGRRPERLRILDVGAGAGDILLELGEWLKRRSIESSGVALDAGLQTVKLARRLTLGRGAIELVCADARALPVADQEFDVAICSTFLHHLETADATIALREMARVSALGMVVSDLRRGWLAYLGALGLARTVWRRHRYSRRDGPASVRAAFTLKEARRLAESAGLRASVEPQPLFRWALRWSRS